MQRAHAKMRTSTRKSIRFLWVGLVGVCSAALTAVGLTRGLDALGQPYRRIRLSQLQVVDRGLKQARSERNSGQRIVFLGDSLSVGISGFMDHEAWISTRLEQILNERAGSPHAVSMVSLIQSGMTVYSYYFLADRVIELDPDEVVVQFDLFWLSENWHRTVERSVFAAALPLAWWREAVTLPLHVTTLSIDRWILYRTLYELGLLDAWGQLQREQARLPTAYLGLTASFQQAVGSANDLGLAKALLPASHRATPLQARELFGPAVDGIAEDHFALRVLDALLLRMRDAGIRVLVFVPPHNMEHLAELGLLNQGGLDKTLAAIGAVVQRRGARFVDLHDLLPDSAFGDHLDHFVNDADHKSSRSIAERLAPAVLDGFPRRRAPKR